MAEALILDSEAVVHALAHATEARTGRACSAILLLARLTRRRALV